jgi:predicted alpha-1,6-mannanase (GH76 family)
VLCFLCGKDQINKYYLDELWLQRAKVNSWKTCVDVAERIILKQISNRVAGCGLDSSGSGVLWRDGSYKRQGNVLLCWFFDSKFQILKMYEEVEEHFQLFLSYAINTRKLSASSVGT